MKVGVPVTLILLPLTYLMLTRVLFKLDLPGIPGGRDWVTREIGRLGPMSRGERVVLAVFLLAALLWIFGPAVRGLEVAGTTPFKPLTDEVIAMGAGLLLFMIPIDVKRGIHALDWSSAKTSRLGRAPAFRGRPADDWAAALQSTGAAAMIGAQAYYEYLAGNIADQTLNAYATRSMEGEAL